MIAKANYSLLTEITGWKQDGESLTAQNSMLIGQQLCYSAVVYRYFKLQESEAVEDNLS